MSTEAEAATVPIRVTPSVHAELVALQRQFWEETRGKISLSDVIRERLETARKAVES